MLPFAVTTHSLSLWSWQKEILPSVEKLCGLEVQVVLLLVPVKTDPMEGKDRAGRWRKIRRVDSQPGVPIRIL